MNAFDGNGAIEVARGERAIIAVPELPREGWRRSGDARIEEAEGLAEAIGIDVIAGKAFRVRAPRPATLLGKGQVEEIAELAKEQGAGLLIVDAALTPVQQKNLEDEAGTKVIDRTGLILEIFGVRRPPKAACRSNSRTSIIRPDAWFGAGPTSNASAVASASLEVRAKRRSKPTVG